MVTSSKTILRPVVGFIAARALSSADRARDEKRWQQAIKEYSKFVRLRPNAANIWVQLGHCLKEGGNAGEAEKAYLKALELEPENADTLLHVGRIALALNDAASAALYLERAAAIPSPGVDAAAELRDLLANSAERALLSGDKARDEKRWGEAIEAYETYLRLRPDAASIWIQLGHCLKEAGKANEAEKAYLRSLELDPENPDTLLHLGRIELALNDAASAARYFERAAAAPSPRLDAREELKATTQN